MGRPLKDNDRTRQRLIDAARDLFVSKGFAATSVRDICTAADANSASVSYHFGGKAELYRAVAEAVSLTVAANWPKAGATVADYPSWDAALDHVLRSLILPAQADDNRTAMIQIGNWELVAPTGLIDDVIRPRLQPVLDLIRELIRTRTAERLDPLTETLAVLSVLQLATTGTHGQRIWHWFGHPDALDSTTGHDHLIALARQFITAGVPKLKPVPASTRNAP
jgi:TetR/AcrR family transcriptional regulator, regulator of cefoperazone and chloramphenicol sensitivity